MTEKQPLKWHNEVLTVYNDDCMNIMAGYPDGYFDLAIVDTPYGIKADKKNSTSKKQSKKSATASQDYGNQEWDNEVPPIEYFKELMRISRHQIMWGVNYYPYNLFAEGRIYWDKKVTMPTYSDGELAYCSKLNSIKTFEFAWHGMIQGDMSNKEKRIHPTQKPIRLYSWLYENFAKPNYKVIDTHLGSGSNAIAAHYYLTGEGAEFVGTEIDNDYYNASIKRIAEETRQLKLF